jgi:penicillin-binding protein-related factor A (putative recombinase)
MSAFNTLERALDDYHKLELLPQELARVLKTPDPMNVMYPLGGGKFAAMYTKKEHVDFQGYLLDGSGRAVLHEAKQTKQPKLTSALFKSHQISTLQQADQVGCLSFASIFATEPDLYFFVPARVLHLLPLSWTQLEKVGCASQDLRWFKLVGDVL